jgi:hypothetical protein
MAFSQISGLPVQVQACYVLVNDPPPPTCRTLTGPVLSLLENAGGLSSSQQAALNQLLGTPLDQLFDQAWLQLQMNPATNANRTVINAIQSVNGTYDVDASVPAQGTLQAQVSLPSTTGTSLTLQYLLPGAAASFSKSGASFNVTFDVTIEIDVWVPADASFSLSVTAQTLVQNFGVSPSNFLAYFYAGLSILGNVLGNAILSALGITNQQVQLPWPPNLPNQTIPATGAALDALSALWAQLANAFALASQQGFDELSVQIAAGPQGNTLEFRLTHPFDAGPVVANARGLPVGVPQLLGAQLTPSVPVVNAGGAVGITGADFPPDQATQLMITWDDTVSGILTKSEVSWGINVNGEAASPTDVMIDRSGPNSNFYTAGTPSEPLMPDMSYAFIVRDYDVFGLVATAWGPWQYLTTNATNQVDLVLSYGDATVGSATVNSSGSFAATVTIPTSTPPGTYTVSAVLAGQQVTYTTITVIGASATATPVLQFIDPSIGVPFGGTINVVVPAEVSVAGTYFEPGNVELLVDDPSGTSLGSATVGVDGTFTCSVMWAGPTGAHAVWAQQAAGSASAPLWASMPAK